MRKLRILMLITAFATLTGCINVDSSLFNQQVKAAWFKGHPYRVENCLYQAAHHQDLTLEEDDPLPDGMKRFNLINPQQKRIAMLDTAKFSDDQTSVNFYYARNDPALAQKIDRLIGYCKE